MYCSSSVRCILRIPIKSPCVNIRVCLDVPLHPCSGCLQQDLLPSFTLWVRSPAAAQPSSAQTPRYSPAGLINANVRKLYYLGPNSQQDGKRSMFLLGAVVLLQAGSSKKKKKKKPALVAVVNGSASDVAYVNVSGAS